MNNFRQSGYGRYTGSDTGSSNMNHTMSGMSGDCMRSGSGQNTGPTGPSCPGQNTRPSRPSYPGQNTRPSRPSYPGQDTRPSRSSCPGQDNRPSCPGQDTRPSGPSCSDSDSCQSSGLLHGCIGDMKDFPLGMAYVPVQSFSNLKSPHEALQCGTLFADLYLDFLGRRCS